MCAGIRWHFRRSDALRFASRARRRNKRLTDQRSFAVSERTERGYDLRLRYDDGCYIGYDFGRLSLDTLAFLNWVAWDGSIWEFHGWASSAGLSGRGFKHSIDNVCHFFTLSRSSINEQTFGVVSYGSGSRLCIFLTCTWVHSPSSLCPHGPHVLFCTATLHVLSSSAQGTLHTCSFFTLSNHCNATCFIVRFTHESPLGRNTRAHVAMQFYTFHAVPI